MNNSNEQFSFSFPKSQRLSSKIEIDELFTKSKFVNSYPIRILYIYNLDQLPNTFPKVLISVPKRKFKRAVDRNLLKRRIKEAYRLNKQKIISLNLKSIGIIYVGNEIVDFNLIQNKLISGFTRLNNKN